MKKHKHTQNGFYVRTVMCKLHHILWKTILFCLKIQRILFTYHRFFINP